MVKYPDKAVRRTKASKAIEIISYDAEELLENLQNLSGEALAKDYKRLQGKLGALQRLGNYVKFLDCVHSFDAYSCNEDGIDTVYCKNCGVSADIICPDVVRQLRQALIMDERQHVDTETKVIGTPSSGVVNKT